MDKIAFGAISLYNGETKKCMSETADIVRGFKKRELKAEPVVDHFFSSNRQEVANVYVLTDGDAKLGSECNLLGISIADMQKQLSKGSLTTERRSYLDSTISALSEKREELMQQIRTKCERTFHI